jgi:hypothetical protein
LPPLAAYLTSEEEELPSLHHCIVEGPGRGVENIELTVKSGEEEERIDLS